MEKRQRFFTGGNLCLLFFFGVCGNLYIDMMCCGSGFFTHTFVGFCLSFDKFRSLL